MAEKSAGAGKPLDEKRLQEALRTLARMADGYLNRASTRIKTDDMQERALTRVVEELEKASRRQKQVTEVLARLDLEDMLAVAYAQHKDRPTDEMRTVPESVLPLFNLVPGSDRETLKTNVRNAVFRWQV